MATTEPTRAENDAQPDSSEGESPGTGPRIPTPPSRESDAPTASTASTASEVPTAADSAVDQRLRRLLRHPVTLTTALAAVLHIIWFFAFANSGGDLAAQDAWAEFVGRHPDSAYNLAWYGGMHPVSYSVVSPYLMSVLGVRTTMMIAGTLSATFLTMILVRSRAVKQPMWPALAGVFALFCNAVSGRVTYGLGQMFALMAVAAVFCWPYRWRYKRWAKALVAAPFAALATMGSPVAGLFVGLVAVALFLSKRYPGAYALGVAPAVVVGLSAWLFPFSGTQPMSIGSASPPLISAVCVYFCVPKQWKTVRITTAVYAVFVLGVWVINSQIGSNITRLAMCFTGVVLLAALPFTVKKSRKWYAIVLALAGFTGWIGYKTGDDIVHTRPVASWTREVSPLIDELREVGAAKGRVEIVPARSHREASAFAPHVQLARGWNRQADMERNPLFYDDTLNSANYREWLQRWAVHYVVLPEGEPDGDGGKREAQLIKDGLPYLKQVWVDSDWRLYEVVDPTPLAEPHAVVERAEQGEMKLRVDRPGRVLIRIPYSPWLSVVDAEGKGVARPEETEDSKQRRALNDRRPKEYANVHGCLVEAKEDHNGDEWVELLAPKAGTYRLGSPYQLPRGTPCPEELNR